MDSEERTDKLRSSVDSIVKSFLELQSHFEQPSESSLSEDDNEYISFLPDKAHLEARYTHENGIKYEISIMESIQ